MLFSIEIDTGNRPSMYTDPSVIRFLPVYRLSGVFQGALLSEQMVILDNRRRRPVLEREVKEEGSKSSAADDVVLLRG